MDVDKEKLKQVVCRLIDEAKWDDAEQLISSVERAERNGAFVKKALVDELAATDG
jgi:hypothetical protein